MQETPAANLKKTVQYASTVVFMTLLQFRLISFVYRDGVPFLAGIAHEITIGNAWWQAFQNKLLGPYLYEFMVRIAHFSPSAGYYFYILLTLLIVNIVFFFLAKKLTGASGEALAATAAFMLLVTASLDRSWLYTWDTLDLLFFSLFAFFVFRRSSPRAFLVLFPFALLNREDAVFIACWLVIDSFELTDNRRIRLPWRQLPRFLLGIALAGFAVYYTFFIRQALWIDNHREAEQVILGSKNLLGYNLKELLLANLTNMNIAVTLAAVLLVSFFVRRLSRSDVFMSKVALLVLLMFGATLSFALINETRAWFIMLPFVVMTGLYSRGAVQPPPSRST